jgi:nucleoside-diphosphate-sugar epimerase
VSLRFVLGPPLALPSTPDKVNETNLFILKVFLGGEIPELLKGEFVDVRDVARLVVFGVEHADETHNQRYLTSSGFANPQAVADILRRAYPERRSVIKQGEPGSGYVADYSRPPNAALADASKAATATGQPWIGIETMVVDTAKAFEKYL